ncbi:hypothetical protein PybrP1_007063 [[Pythium] brassicae (nom. inval.)]|nr:hypothetical protein PybrP1_007063 [[Pythium] brassicae (nom. inval.)]
MDALLQGYSRLPKHAMANEPNSTQTTSTTFHPATTDSTNSNGSSTVNINNINSSSPPRRGHRRQSQVWKLLTTKTNPHLDTRTECRHCGYKVSHHHKSEKARVHLQRCAAFRTFAESLSGPERPAWLDVPLKPLRGKRQGWEVDDVTVVGEDAFKDEGEGENDVAASAGATTSRESAENNSGPVGTSTSTGTGIGTGTGTGAGSRANDTSASDPSPPDALTARQQLYRQQQLSDLQHQHQQLDYQLQQLRQFQQGQDIRLPPQDSGAPTENQLKRRRVDASATDTVRRDGPPSRATAVRKRVSPAPMMVVVASQRSAAVVAELAMFFYTTATPFQSVENEHLRAALRLSHPGVTLPTAANLAGPLLDEAHAATQARVDAVLSAFEFNSIAVNGWSGGGGAAGASLSPPPTVHYMVVNEQHAFLLETSDASVDDLQSQRQLPPQSAEKRDADMLASKMVRVMDRCGRPISGVVTDNTPAHQLMWSKLKAAFPCRFFHGCASHGLHLFVQDIFAPGCSSNSSSHHVSDRERHDNRQQQQQQHEQALQMGRGSQSPPPQPLQSAAPQYPDGYPFEELARLLDTCQRVVSVVSQDEASVRLLAPTPLLPFTGDWRSLRAAFRSLLAAHATLRAIVSARAFVSQAPSETGALTDARGPDEKARARVQQDVLSAAFVPLLEKAAAILAPIEHLMGVFERERVACSEVFSAFAKALPDALVRIPGLTKAERTYLLALNQTRFNFLYGDAHGIAYLLDPRYIAGRPALRRPVHALVEEAATVANIEDVIFDLPLAALAVDSRPAGAVAATAAAVGGRAGAVAFATGGERGSRKSSSTRGAGNDAGDDDGDDDNDDDDDEREDERKMEIAQQLTEFVIDATREKNSNSFRYSLLCKKKKSALQYWLTDGQRWPLLQRVACEVFSLPSSTLAARQRVAAASAPAGAIPAELRASLSPAALAKLVYVRVNSSSSIGVSGGAKHTREEGGKPELLEPM